MADLTPLSIAQPLTRAQKKWKQDIESFEEKIDKKNFKLEGEKPKLGFGSEYRDASADDEMEAEDSYKYPAAPLPLLVPKAPRGTYDRACFSRFKSDVWDKALSQKYLCLMKILPLPTRHAWFSECMAKAFSIVVPIF